METGKQDPGSGMCSGPLLAIAFQKSGEEDFDIGRDEKSSRILPFAGRNMRVSIRANSCSSSIKTVRVHARCKSRPE